MGNVDVWKVRVDFEGKGSPFRVRACNSHVTGM